jgi:hypothetical protein
MGAITSKLPPPFRRTTTTATTTTELLEVTTTTNNVEANNNENDSTSSGSESSDTDTDSDSGPDPEFDNNDYDFGEFLLSCVSVIASPAGAKDPRTRAIYYLSQLDTNFKFTCSSKSRYVEKNYDGSGIEGYARMLEGITFSFTDRKKRKIIDEWTWGGTTEGFVKACYKKYKRH